MKTTTFSLLAAFAGLCLVPQASASRLLIDDFSIPQEGILTDQIVEFDLLQDPRLFGGGRVIWGGPNDPPTPFGAKVEDGLLQLNTTPDGIGAGNVTWPDRPGNVGGQTIDLSGFRFLEFTIEELTGADIEGRIGINFAATPTRIIDLILNEAQPYRIRLPEDRDLSSVVSLNFSALLNRGDTVSISSFWLVVPEPSAICLAVAMGVLFLTVRQGSTPRTTRQFHAA